MIIWGSMGPDSTIADAGLEKGVGRPQSLVHLGQSLAYGRKPDGTPNYAGFAARAQPMLQKCWDAGQLAILDFETWDLNNQRDLAFNNAGILSGQHDTALHAFFREAAAWKHPFMLLPDVESNGDWYLYSDRAAWANNAPGSFVKRYQHIHDIATAEGASNITWAFNVNVCAPSGTPWATAQPIANVFPGADYCDWLSIDGFDWANSRQSPHISFAETFGGRPGWYRDTYGELTALAPGKPVLIASYASADETQPRDPMTKAAAVTSLFDAIRARFTAVAAISYFNWNADGATWALQGDSMAAFAAGVTGPGYQAGGPGFVMPPDMQPIAVYDPVALLQARLVEAQAQLALANAATADAKAQYAAVQANLQALLKAAGV